jgi:hypothetical protein
MRGPKRQSLLEKLERHVERADGCWLWKGSRSKSGYGQIGHGRLNNFRAHRVAYQVLVGSIPKGMCVLHRCDNPACCNPAHLFLGTNADNSADMVAKDRQCKGERHWTKKRTPLVPRGDNHHKAKLTDIDVSDIRFLCGNGLTQRQLSLEYGVRQSSIWAAIHGSRAIGG